MRIGKYEILSELGRGGFGMVYRARDTSLNRDVAIKVLHPQLTINVEFVARFRKEAQMLAALEHPNIVSIYEYNQVEGRNFIAMRYLSGGNLADYIRQHGKMSLSEAMPIIRGIIEGLTFAHERGLVHRDIKPQNILFDQRGNPLITDFGLAKLVQLNASASSHSVGSIGLGTPYYKAPEVWNGESGSPATDQYSLACVIVEMLSGSVLFQADTTPAVMLKHFEPVVLPEDLPQGLQTVLLRALDKDPAKRFSHVKDLLQALEESLLMPAKAAKQPDRKPALTWMLFGFLGVCALAVIAFLLFGQDKDRQRAAAEPTQSALSAEVLPTLSVEKDSSPAEVVVSAPKAENPAAVVNTLPAPTSQVLPTQVSTVQVLASLSIPSTPTLMEPTSTTASPVAAFGEMVFIPEGEFPMGCDPNHNGGYGCDPDELPAHPVFLDSFYIDKFEVTNAQYEQCVSDGACEEPKSTASHTRYAYFGNSEYADYPVIFVNWYDAQDYCTWAGKRLPTEAEWEKAAKGTSFKAYPWGDREITCDRANFADCVGDTSPVGSFTDGASEYGVMDLTGNVWEWVQDGYSENAYATLPDRNPVGPFSSTSVVLRGGSWGRYWSVLRIARRGVYDPEESSNVIGFRCASN